MSAKAASAEERRVHARVGADIYCVVDGATEGRIRDLSLGGALLLGPPDFADLGDTVSLEFEVREVDALTVFGDVVRITPQGTYAEYGIRHVHHVDGGINQVGLRFVLRAAPPGRKG